MILTIPDTPEAKLFGLLNPLYRLPGYAGLILLTENLDILENQFPYSDEKAAAIVTPLLQLHHGLCEASRDVEFLSVQLEEYQYLLIQVRTGVMLLRLDTDANLDDVKSIVQRVVEKLSPMVNSLSMELIGEIFYTKQGMTAEEVAHALKKSLRQKQHVPNDRCDQFLSKIHKLIVQLENKEIADDLFKKGFTVAGSRTGRLTPKQIKEFSISVANEIGNVKKRKKVAQEMLNLARSLEL